MPAVITARGPYSRRHACIDCGVEATATRPNSRCVACSNHRKRVVCNAWKCAERARRAALRAAPPPVVDEPMRLQHEDTNIALYRAEKAKRAHREDARIADARRLLLVLDEAMQPKRGRPKKGQEQAA